MKKHIATILLCTLVVTVYFTNRDTHMRQKVQDKELETASVALQPNLQIVKMITELQTFDTPKTYYDVLRIRNNGNAELLIQLSATNSRCRGPKLSIHANELRVPPGEVESIDIQIATIPGHPVFFFEFATNDPDIPTMRYTVSTVQN